MANLKVYSLQQEEVGSIELNDEWLKQEPKPHLVKDVVVAHLNGLRQGTHSVKTTSQVSGSNKKLFRQKGTGNARAGSRKAIQRRHGGVQFGPHPRQYKLKVNKKVSRQVFYSVLAQAIRQEQVKVFDSFSFAEPKTKKMVEIMSQWQVNKALIVDGESFDTNFALSARNIGQLKLVSQSWMHVYDILKYQNLWISKQALQTIDSRFSA